MDDLHSEEGGSGEPCFYYEIPGGLLDKDVIEITGYFYGEKIAIEVLAEKFNKNGENTALPLQFTLTNTGKWTAMTYTETIPRQLKSGTAPAAENFQIRIVAFDTSFEIHLNGEKLCTQKHLVPLPQVTHISIDGDAEFTGVEFKDLLSENEGSSHSGYHEFNDSEAVAGLAPGFTRLSENRRSSNRKPKPPVVVPTHGSFRSKPALATTREEPETYVDAKEDINLMTRAAPEGSRVSADLGSFRASGGRNSGKRGSLLSTSKKKNFGSRDSLKTSIRDKLHLKRGSGGSIRTSARNEIGSSGDVEDVWVEEGGPEYSADGPGYFTVAGAASVPNLSTQPEKGKEKKKFGFGHHIKKTHSTSTPPGEEKKKHHGGIHFGMGSKKEKEPKPEKEKGTKRSFFGKKSSRHGSTKDLSGDTAVIITEHSNKNEYANPDIKFERATLPTVAESSRSGSRGSLMDSHGKGHYDIVEAERKFHLHSGSYQRASDGSENVALGVEVELKDGKKNKLKGDSPNLASNLMDGPATSRGVSEFFTVDDPSLNVPLRLESANRVEASSNAVSFATPKEERKKKEKLKGSSSDIADDLLGTSRAMSRDFENFTGNHVVEPLTLVQEDILSINGKSFAPVLAAKGSYDLANSPKTPVGKYQPRADVPWEDEPQITQKTAISNVQHSKPPGVELEGGAVLVTGTSVVSKREKKHTFKGESSEIASNLFDEEGVKVMRSSSLDGYPVCGKNGFNMPLKIDASNRDAQPVPYGIASSRSTERINGKNRAGGEYAINASFENEVNAAAPYSGTLDGRSATLPASGEYTVSEGAAAIPVGGVAMRDEKEKHRKRDRFSGFFRKIFKRRRKSGASMSEDDLGVTEGVGTDCEMTEYRTSSQQSFDFDGDENNFTVTASPSEKCLYASQLCGNKSALKRSAHIQTMCNGGVFQVPLVLTAADIPKDISSVGSKYVFGAVPLQKQRSDSLRSWSSTSPGGTRRIYHLRSGHRPDSASSWSSITPNGTRRHTSRSMQRHRSDSLRSWSSISPGGTRRIYHLTNRHRPESASSWSSITPNGTRRHTNRSMQRHRSDSLRSWSSTSPGGTRRIYHLTGRHRPESASSWSSITPNGTRRHRSRHDMQRINSLDSVSTWSSVTAGGSRHHYHRSNRHRPESVSSWSSISPHGTRRHRRRSEMILEMKSSAPNYAVNGSDQFFDSLIDIKKQETTEVHSAYPEAGSAQSSNSSIPSLYGRVVIVGQSPGFRMRIQSYRKRMEMPKKKKGENGYDSGSNSSISSIASERLPPTVVKMHGGEFAIYEDAKETIFDQRPLRKEDTYAINSRLY